MIWTFTAMAIGYFALVGILAHIILWWAEMYRIKTWVRGVKIFIRAMEDF